MYVKEVFGVWSLHLKIFSQEILSLGSEAVPRLFLFRSSRQLKSGGEGGKP